VRNSDRSPAPCAAVPAEYEVTGHLTLPAKSAVPGQVTLYLHDLDAGEWYWRTDVPGYHQAEEMAKRGDASVTIDRPGHGTSGGRGGYTMCVGIQADVATQIVAMLRTGSYTADGPGPPPAFASVVLAGHGTGAQIAQLAAMTGKVDGLVVMDWSDAGRTERFTTDAFANLSSCMQQAGPDQTPTTAGGYTFLDLGSKRFAEANFADPDPAVLREAVPRQERHACGEIASLFEGISVDLRGLHTITAPVLGIYGGADKLFQDGPGQVSLFAAAARADVVVIPGSGHYSGLDRGAAEVHDAMAAWLAAR